MACPHLDTAASLSAPASFRCRADVHLSHCQKHPGVPGSSLGTPTRWPADTDSVIRRPADRRSRDIPEGEQGTKTKRQNESALTEHLGSDITTAEGHRRTTGDTVSPSGTRLMVGHSRRVLVRRGYRRHAPCPTDRRRQDGIVRTRRSVLRTRCASDTYRRSSAPFAPTSCFPQYASIVRCEGPLRRPLIA